MTLGLEDTPGLLIAPGFVTPGLVVPGVVSEGFVVVGLVRPGPVVPPIEELPTEDPGVVPVIGCGVEPNVPVIGALVPGVAPNVPVIGAPVPGVPPMLGLLMPGAVLESMVGEVLNDPDPVIGAGPTPAFAPKVPMVPDGVTGDTPVAPGATPVVPGAPPTAPVPPAAPGAAVCANETGAAAINAAAIAAGIKDFRLSMRVSPFDWERKPLCRKQRACG